MKKNRLLFLLLSLFMVCIGARADEVQIGEGTMSNNYLPGYNFYNYSFTQQIYTAEEIGTNGTINSIAFKNVGAEKTRTYSIYMSQTDKDAFANGSEWIPVSDADLVFSGELTFTVGEWTVIELNTPFEYDDASNLLVSVADNSGNYSSSPHMSCLAFDAPKQAIRAYRDSGAYNVSAPGDNGTVLDVKNQIILDIDPPTGDCERPSTITVGEVTAHEVTLTWEGGSGTYNVEYKTNAEEEWSLGASNLAAYTLTLEGLEQNTSYQARVQSVCDVNEVSAWKSISFTTAIACPAPTGLTAQTIPGDGTSAILSWTENGQATEWQICLNDDEENLINANSNPFTVTNLTPEAIYSAKVRAIDGDEHSSWSEPVTFNPTEKVIIGSGTGTSGNLPTNCYYRYTLSEQIYTASEIGDEPGAILSVDFFNNATSERVRTLNVYLVSTEKNSFSSTSDWIPVTASDMVFSGSVTFAPQAWTTIEFDNTFIYDGSSNVAIIIDDNTGSYASTTPFLAYEATGQAIRTMSDSTNPDPENPSGGQVENMKNQIRLLIGDVPSCIKPSGLTVDYTGGTTAVVTWEGDADSYDIEVNGQKTEGVTSPYTLENLEMATPYAVKVRANCGGGDFSEWTNEVEFITDLCMPEDQCVITLALTDSYGDGWNGNAIQVVDNATGNVLGTFANTSEAGKNEPQYYSLNVCKDRQIDFVWVKGSYGNETSWVITDVNEDIILSDQGTNDLATGTVLGSFTPDCLVTSCRKVTDLAVSEIASNSVKLSWTENGEAEEWTIAYKEDADEEFTEIDVIDNPYVLNNLSPETHYTVKVKSECDVDKWSDEIDFTTAEAGVIAGLTISDINPTTATASWTGDAENYELRYAPIDGSSLLQYDDDTYYTGIGNSSTMTWTWGVMYPADMVTGNVLTKVAVYETAANTGDITINIYQGGDDAPGTLIHTETVAPECGDAFHEITLSDLVQIDPEQNLWITLTETGTYVMAAFNNASDTNSQWVEDEGQWAPIGQLSPNLAGYGWMIRGSLVSMDMDNIAWTEDTSAESTYAMDGLEPNTQYIFQVRSVVDDSTYGNWATAFFDTPSQCDAPNSLAVADITATSANVSWVGYQEAYNLKYTNAPKISVNSFDQVGEDETATGVLTEYTFDLSGFEGTGTIAIRHYNVTDQFRLIIDDITLSDDKGETLLSEDFDDGAVPDDWINYDADGDGHVWMFWTAQDDNAGNPTANGSYALQSESYDNNTGALTPDNWLIIPNVELGGTLTLVARGLDPSYPAEVFGVFVSTEQVVRPSESVVVENVTSPYTIEGLEPGTTYMVEVQGVNDECGQTMWSSPIYFDTSNTITVTIKEGFDGTTIASPYALDFSVAPDLTVYKVTGTIGKKTVYIATDELTEGIVPAEEGILVKGPAGTYEIEIVDNAENTFFEDNLLVGAIEGYAPTSDDVAAKTVYRYGKAGGKCGFQLVTKTSQTVGAGKAYLRLTEALAQAAASLGITFGDDETTGIDAISGDMLDESAPMYNTAGQRVQKSYKGVVIQNGKKYIKK